MVGSLSVLCQIPTDQLNATTSYPHHFGEIHVICPVSNIFNNNELQAQATWKMGYWVFHYLYCSSITTDLCGCFLTVYRERRRGWNSENRNRWARYLKIKSMSHEVLMCSTWKDDRLLLRWYPGLARHNELTSHELKLCYSGAEETLKARLSLKLGFLDVVSFFRNCMCMLE